MTDNTQLDPYQLPPNAVNWNYRRPGTLAYVGKVSSPDEFFLCDDTGKWHCVEDFDFYAVAAWHDHSAEMVITEPQDSGCLVVRFRDWRDGPEVIMEPILWPEERGEVA